MTGRPSRWLARWAAALVAALITVPSAANEAPATLILFNGKIVTVDDAFSIREAVAIRGERILAVGTDTAMEAHKGPNTRLVDLGGRTVIPGLIDNHVHFIRGTEYWGNEARLDGVTDRGRALEIIAEKAASLPAGEWVLTLGGWHEDQFVGDDRGFSRADLDRAAPDNPAFVQAKYAHAFVNTAWLVAMGFPVRADAAYRAAATGLAADVERDEDGVASGRLGGGFWMVRRAIARFPEVPDAKQIADIKRAMADFNALGLTAVYDPGGMGISPESYERLERVVAAGDSTLRVFHTLWGGVDVESRADVEAMIAKLKANTPFQGTPWLDMIGFGEVYYPPFHFDDLTRTVAPGPDVLANARDILTAAAAGGWSVQTHAIQPATIAGVLDVAERVHRIHPIRPLRWSIAHADNIGAAEIARARALGINLQLRSERIVGGLAEVFEAHGEAVHRMPPLRLVQDSGIRYGLGSDGTKATQINPFLTLWWAVTGRLINGDVVTEQTLSREEALIAHSRANAYIAFQEANLGSLSPGLLADMVVLDRDYLTVPEEEIRHIRPVATLVGGRIVHGGL